MIARAPIIAIVVSLALAIVLIINAIIYHHEKTKGGINGTNADIMIIVNCITLVPVVGILVISMMKVM